MRLPTISRLYGTTVRSACVALLSLVTVSAIGATSQAYYNLSPIAQYIDSAIRADDVLRNSPVSEEWLLSRDNLFAEIYIDGPQIFNGIKDVISQAQHEVDIVFYVWDENSQATALIGEGLRDAIENRSAGNKLLVRMMLSDFEPGFNRVINKLYNSVKKWNLDKSKVTFQLATHPHGAFGALHDKTIVVDGYRLVVTGANPEKVHDDKPDKWHDSGYYFIGSVGRSALASVDEAWNYHGRHWDCRPRSFGFDCVDSYHPQPSRPWLQYVYSGGNIPMIAVGRKADGSITNATNNPQDVAWLTALDNATSHVHVETPNINDDGFRAAVIRAATRDVEVRLITSLGFNRKAVNLPFQGGDNQEVAGELLGIMRDAYPAFADKLKICWYSRDGLEIMVGKPNSHVKYMSVDGDIAIVGSGNMDTQSWNHSREFNVVVDSRAAVQTMESELFGPDWNRAICSVFDFYEGNGGTQESMCTIGAIKNKTINLKSSAYSHCDNDEARSVRFRDVIGPKTLTLFDHPDRKREDDWTEIIIKRNIKSKLISTFQRSFEDDDVRVIYHRNNGLDGKVSSMTLTSDPASPSFDFYEGNNASQNLVCSLEAKNSRAINFKNHSQCDNDEARSIVLYSLNAGHKLTVYDNPDGKKNDDWTEIIVKRDIKRKVINTFQRSFEDSDVRVIYHKDNGLDGKVSRAEISVVVYPQAPTLTSPANGATDVSVSPTLRWINSGAGTTKYQLQVDNNNNFSSPVYNNSSVAQTYRTVSSLANDTRYYWRVRAYNGVWGNWSAVRNFVTVTWSASIGGPSLLTPGTRGNWTANPSGGTYQWWVRSGSGAWSSAGTFRTYVKIMGTNSFELKVDVTKNGVTKDATHDVFSSGGGGCLDCIP